MPDIPFTQYMRPDGRSLERLFGRTKDVTIDRPDHVADKAQQIIAAGYRFECEILSTGEVSLTITDDEADHAIEVVPNGPGMGEAVDRLVLGFALPVV